ncbi:MAG TPA: hypothetical protein VG433_05505 [Pirellulales bacterium]|nr:hypothetical protein [Pirellulales bacterium]
MITRRKLFAGAAALGSLGLLPKLAEAEIIGWKIFAGPPQDWVYQGTWAPTTMPYLNNQFRKLYDESWFHVDCFGDFVSPDTHSCFHGVWIDGQNWASIAIPSPPGEDATFCINDYVPYLFAKGEHTFQFTTAKFYGAPATWQLAHATTFKVMEVMLPPLSQ